MKNAKINGRKFLSLFLSVLMVLGTLVTLVPTTVMAATDALVLLPGDLNATSVGSGAANLDPAFVDGGKTYLKIDPVNATNNGVSVLCTLDEAYDAELYNYVKVGFKANVSTASGAFRFLVSDAGGTAKTKKDVAYWSGTRTEITEDDIIVDISSNTYELQYFNLLPFAGQKATAIDGTGELYFNISYVAFFETEDEANAFDFDEYMGDDAPPATTTPEPVVFNAADLENQIVVNGHVNNGLISEGGVKYINIQGAETDTVYNGKQYFRVNIPENVPVHTYQYAVIGYKSNISLPTGIAAACGGGLTFEGTVRRVYGIEGELVGDATNRKMIMNFADFTAGDSLPTGATFETVDADSPVSYLRISPYGPRAQFNVATMYATDYFNIEYVAFFTDEASANAYVHTYPEEPEDDTTVDLVDCHVFEPEEITASASGFFADGITTVDGIKYYRFTGPEEKYEYTRDFYNIINVPEAVSAHKYNYAVIGYRTNIADTASVSVGLLPTDGTAYKRFWGLYDELNGSVGAMIVNIEDINAGEVSVTDFDTSIDKASNVKYLRVGPHKTYGNEHSENEYFDVQYIAFFKNQVSAEAYAESRMPVILPKLDMDIDSPYHIFIANQLAGKTNGHVANGIINENDSQYLSYSGPVGGATYTGSEYIQFSFPKEIHAHTYRYVAVGYKSNIELPAGTPTADSVGVTIAGVADRVTGFNGDINPSEENEKMIVSLTGSAKLDSADYESPISYFRIALYGGRPQFDKAYMAEDDYFDIEYIGFFKTLEAAQAYEFDFESELKNLEKNYGDANGDGKATTVDSVILMRQLAGWTGYETLAKPKNLDVNLDGEVNALDVTIMVRNLANWSDYKTMPYLHDYNDYINYREPLKNSYTKLTEEKSLTVAYLGGSITLGRSYENNCWRTMFDAWLKEDYPTAEIKMIHAGIGGTGSSYGAYRIDEVLKQDPDLVFIEFAANDNHFDPKYGEYELTKEIVQEFYEAIIQQIYAHDPETDIVMVYTQTAAPKYPMDRYGTSTAAQEELAEYYNINSVYFGNALINYIEDNNFTTTDYIYDYLHPTDKGYEIMLKPLREMFVNNWGGVDETGLSDKVLPEKTMSAHDRKDAYMVLRDNLTYDASVWTKSEFGVKTTTPGATLSFSFTGDEVAVYTSVSSTAGVIEFRIDGGEWTEKSLCGPVVSERVPLISGLDYETHTFELRVPEDLTSGHTVNLRGILIN